MSHRSCYSSAISVATVLFRIPLLGYLLRIVVGILKLPRMNFHLRRMDRELQEDRLTMRAELARMLERLDSVPSFELVLATERARVNTLATAFPKLVEAAASSQTAIRMLRRERARLPEMSGLPMVQPDGMWIDPQIEIVPERQLRLQPPTTWNRMPRLSDWSAGGALSDRMTELRQPHLLHRRMWEYAICIEGLEQLGAVGADAVGLAVGAGSKQPLYYYANTIARMVATDLYAIPEPEPKPAMLTQPASLAPFPYREDRLEVRGMPGDALDFPDAHFDFAFCLASIEHFGSRKVQARAFSEMGRVVRRGGVVCVIIELILNGERHPGYFTPAELWDMFLQHPVLKLIGPLDMRMSDALPPLAVDVRVPAELAVSPHIVLTDGRVLWTSLSMFFRRG